MYSNQLQSLGHLSQSSYLYYQLCIFVVVQGLCKILTIEKKKTKNKLCIFVWIVKIHLQIQINFDICTFFCMFSVQNVYHLELNRFNQMTQVFITKESDMFITVICHIISLTTIFVVTGVIYPTCKALAAFFHSGVND